MAQSMYFMKTGSHGKISQVSGFQNYLQMESDLLILSVRGDSKNPVCHDGPCSSTHFFFLPELGGEFERPKS